MRNNIKNYQPTNEFPKPFENDDEHELKGEYPLLICISR